jgi:hypothetical protein
MSADRITLIGGLFGGVLVTGICMIFAGRSMQGPLAVAHKLLAVICLILLLRSVGALRAFHAPPALPIAIAVFAVAFLAAFATGIVQSIPASAGLLWLNLHRFSSAIAAIACAVAARFVATVAHS